MRTILVPALASLLVFPAHAAVQTPAERLHALFQEEWEWRLAEFPVFAMYTGDDRYNDRLASVTEADAARRAEYRRRLLARVRSIEPATLGGEDRISRAMFVRELEDALASYRFREHLMPITAETGFHTRFASLPRATPFRDVGDYEDYLARLRAWPGYVDQHIALMRRGMAVGVVQPRAVLDGFEVTIASHVVDGVEESVFWPPFEAFPQGVPEPERARLREAGREAIRDAVVPGYRRFLDFFTEEYRPAARETLGASELPDGRDYYGWLVRHFTTLEVTPEEVHEIGRAEVARIRGEMEAIIARVGFEGSFEEFLAFLRTDPRFYAETPDELLREAAWIAKRMDGELPALFRTLPRQPYTVAPVPDHLAPKYTGGRYIGAPIDGREPGTYWVNTYDLSSRPLYTLEALTLHEAVPGHHLQNALRQELEELPSFRRFGGIGAYGEGWGLYAEWLGIEAGFYQDPYRDFGRLTYEMWRACRLVVDTGLHWYGWTRQQAIDFLAGNTALSIHEVTTETDRYISWPGQALGYKMGELTIRKLRRRAEEALGPAFDVRAFHDVVLLSGPVPLDVLEGMVDRWIAEQSAPR